MKEAEIVDRIKKKALPIPPLMGVPEADEPDWVVYFEVPANITIYTSAKDEREAIRRAREDIREAITAIEDSTKHIDAAVSFDSRRLRVTDVDDVG